MPARSPITIPHPFRGLTLAVVAAAFALALALGPNLQTALVQPVFIGILLALVPLLALVRSGWIALAAIEVWAIGLGLMFWIGSESGRGVPDATPPRTDWIGGAIGWLLFAYCLAIVGFLAGIGRIRGGEASRDVRWIHVVFVPAAMAALLVQLATALYSYDYPG